MWGPAAPVVVFLRTFSKLTQALPSGVTDFSFPVLRSTSRRQSPYWSLRAGPKRVSSSQVEMQGVRDVEPPVVPAQPEHVRVRHGDGRVELRRERVADVELLHRVPEPVRHVHVAAVVGEQEVGRDQQAVVRPEHLLEVEDAVVVVVVGEPDGARPGHVDERATDTARLDEADHERAVVRAQVGSLDHFLPLEVPDGDLVAEARRVDTSAAQRRRPERSADPPVRFVQHREVVHVLRRQSRPARRPRAEVAHELAGLVVELDEAARRRRVGCGSDHRGDELPVHRHDAVRDDVAAVGCEILVQRAQPQALPASLHVEDVNAVREQARDDQALLVGRVAEVMELVAGLRHIDAVHDPTEVGIARVRADHGDEVGVVGALRERGDVEIPLLLRVGGMVVLSHARGRAARRRLRLERDRERRRHRRGETECESKAPHGRASNTRLNCVIVPLLT